VRLYPLLLATACLGVCFEASAVDMTVYGIEIGAPFRMAECAYVWSGYLKQYQSPREPCLQAMYPIEDVPIKGASPDVQVHFPVNDLPRALAPAKFITPLVIGEKLALLTIPTDGIDSQAQIYADLTAKYGKPSSRWASTLQNGFGAKYVAVLARWELPGLRVEFVGAANRIDTGVIRIGTPAGHREAARQEKAAARSGPRL